MTELNLELNHTYLLQFGSSDAISSVTILIVTDKAYYVRWNRGHESNDTWELKSKMYRNYIIIEDISDVMKDIKFKTLNVTNCPECLGKGWFPDDQTTGGRKTCTNCWGNGKVVDSIS